MNFPTRVITHITNSPIASSVSDHEGANGHVNIVVPRPSRVYGADEAALAMREGARAVDV